MTSYPHHAVLPGSMSFDLFLPLQNGLQRGVPTSWFQSLGSVSYPLLWPLERQLECSFSDWVLDTQNYLPCKPVRDALKQENYRWNLAKHKLSLYTLTNVALVDDNCTDSFWALFNAFQWLFVTYTTSSHITIHKSLVLKTICELEDPSHPSICSQHAIYPRIINTLNE